MLLCPNIHNQIIRTDTKSRDVGIRVPNGYLHTHIHSPRDGHRKAEPLFGIVLVLRYRNGGDAFGVLQQKRTVGTHTDS
jgi:hypothetical protein